MIPAEPEAPPPSPSWPDFVSDSSDGLTLKEQNLREVKCATCARSKCTECATQFGESSSSIFFRFVSLADLGKRLKRSRALLLSASIPSTTVQMLAVPSNKWNLRRLTYVNIGCNLEILSLSTAAAAKAAWHAHAHAHAPVHHPVATSAQ